MDSIPSSLSAHQKGPARKPQLSLTVSNTRHSRPTLSWTRYYTGTEDPGPVAAALTAAGTLVRARNDNGNIRVSRVTSPGHSSTYSSWTLVDSGATPGTGVALCALPAELVLLYVSSTGTLLRWRNSTDDGATWSSAATILTEATNPISWVAIGTWNGINANLCAFYLTQPFGGKTLLRRVRRTSGTWAGSGTTWTRTANIEQLTGLAATHDGSDFQLIVTGSADTTERKHAWGVLMGDLDLPTNAWSTLVPIVDFGAASTVVLSAPSLTRAAGHAVATYAQEETGDVANRRNHLTVAEAVNADAFLEPYPIEAANTHEAAVTGYRNLETQHWMVTPAGVWEATTGQSRDLTPRVISARWAYGPATHSAEFVLDNTAGDLFEVDQLQIQPGMDLTLGAGYRSGTNSAPQFGAARRFVVQSVEHRFDAANGASLTSGPVQIRPQNRANSRGRPMDYPAALARPQGDFRGRGNRNATTFAPPLRWPRRNSPLRHRRERLHHPTARLRPQPRRIGRYRRAAP